MELSSPFRGWLQSVNFEQIIQEGEEHWIVVGKDEQVHCQKVSTGLYNTIGRYKYSMSEAYLEIAKGMACVPIPG